MKYRARRKPTDFPVLLLTETGSQQVALLNVTLDGGRVRLNDMAVERDEIVTLKLRDRHFGASVIWTKGNEAGLTFSRKLPPDVFAIVSRST